MSGTLHLEVGAVPAERARVDLLVVPVFSDERPLRGSAGRADWRLCGLLSRLAAEGRLEGRAGEAVLVASFGGLAAPLVLALGMGSRLAFDAGGVEFLAHEAVSRALALRVATLALGLGETAHSGAGLRERAEEMMAGAADAMAARAAQPPAELRLLLLVREDELPRAADVLRTSRPARLPASVALRCADPAARAPSRGPFPVPSTRRAVELPRSEP